jgi:hypothetical protein
MSVLKTATYCWRQVTEAEIQAAQITDQHLKAVYLRIAHQWSVLARSYEFADSAERFLLDAKRTKDANARQLSAELVPLAVVARESRNAPRFIARELEIKHEDRSLYLKGDAATLGRRP